MNLNFYIKYFEYSISGTYFANHFEKVTAIKRAFTACGASKLAVEYTSTYANAVLFMVAEFEDNTVEVVPENWGYRPQPGSKDKPSVAIPDFLDKVCCPVLNAFWNGVTCNN
jgi:hypothetical protein